MKPHIFSAIFSPLIFFILLFTYVKLAGPIPFSINSVTTQKTDTFQVTGEGKAEVKPDNATVRAGVQVNAATEKEAKDQMNSAINKVTAAIKALGIAESDIKTDNFNINPNYDYSQGAQKINGYSGNTNITIKVKDVTKVNQVIDTATANGANVIGGAQFDNVDKTAAENEARVKAVADARAKAQNAARVAGFTLGKLLNYQETTGANNPRPYMMAKAQDSAQAAPPTQIEPGTNEVNLTVTLSYEVK